MKPILIPALVSVPIIAALWPASALANDVPSQYEDNDTPQAASPPSSTPRIIVASPPRDVATFEEKRPNAALITGGSLMFGMSYGASVIVGALSENKADQHLFIPVVGPFMNLANRSCPEGASCPNEPTNKVLLATDGLLQVAGVLQIAGGFLFPEKTTVTRSVSKGVRITPTFGRHGVGVSASGSF